MDPDSPSDLPSGYIIEVLIVGAVIPYVNEFPPNALNVFDLFV